MNNLHRYLDLPFEIKKPDIVNTTPTERFHTDLMSSRPGIDKNAYYRDYII